MKWQFRNAATAAEFCYHVRRWCIPDKVARAGPKVTVRIPDAKKLQEARELAEAFEGKRVPR